MNQVAQHYAERGRLLDRIAEGLARTGKTLDGATTGDLAAVDEFHIRGRKATLELAEGLRLSASSRVLDLGSGLGGPARTLAEVHGCHVTGIDLTPEFCEVATVLSDRIGLSDRVTFIEGDATDLPFGDATFDAAMTIHVAMNIAAKHRLYAEAHRVLKPGGRFAVYDIMQGDGGDILYPVPWARDAAISFVAPPDEVEALLVAAGFKVLERRDSSEESIAWFKALADESARNGPPPLSLAAILGEGRKEMVRNQVVNLAERRTRTVAFLCEA